MSMDIQEAIEHLNDVLNDDDRWTDCAECKAEHEQLREWLEELQKYREIGTVEELKHIKTLYEKVDFERLSKLSQEEDIETFTVNVNFSYNQLLDRDEAVALLIENIINILDKEA